MWLLLATIALSLSHEGASADTSPRSSAEEAIDALVPEGTLVTADASLKKNLYDIVEGKHGRIAIIPAGAGSGKKGFKLQSLTDEQVAEERERELQLKNAAQTRQVLKWKKQARAWKARAHKQVSLWKARARKAEAAGSPIPQAMATIKSVTAQLEAGKWKGKANKYRDEVEQLAGKAYHGVKWKAKAKAAAFKNAVGNVKALAIQSKHMAAALKEVKEETSLLKVVDAERKKWKVKATHLERVVKAVQYKKVMSKYKDIHAPTPAPIRTVPTASRKGTPKTRPSSADTNVSTDDNTYKKFMASHHYSYKNYLAMARKLQKKPSSTP